MATLFGLYPTNKKWKEYFPPQILEAIFQQISNEGVIFYSLISIDFLN